MSVLMFSVSIMCFDFLNIRHTFIIGTLDHLYLAVHEVRYITSPLLPTPFAFFTTQQLSLSFSLFIENQNHSQ